MQEKNNNIIERPPVIAVMGHVDHGKSTLLDYIRKTSIVDGEAGGITQKISAYEVVHETKAGPKKITFLDTPGHEAFTAIRSRGAKVADIAILVVSAEDGVRPQTVEALKIIRAAKIPFIVAINKIDKEGADVERTKVNLAENEIYVEGYGGDISYVPISAKTGKGIPELLDLIMLTAEVENLTSDAHRSGTGVVIEANLDRKKGLAATLVIKDGTVAAGSYVVAGNAISPVRIIENFAGKPIKEAISSSPIRIIGWSELPLVGATFQTFATKKLAEEYVASHRGAVAPRKNAITATDTGAILPVVLKASEVGSLDALHHEVSKIKNDKLAVRVVHAAVGEISENDVKMASASGDTVILGFNVKVDAGARSLAEKLNIPITVFDIIYKLSEHLAELVRTRAPKTQFEESTGIAKILKLFSKVKDRQVIGGRVEQGTMVADAEVKIMRRDFEIGRGRIRELQRAKVKVGEVPEGQEFGTMIESRIEIAPGDRVESFKVVEK
jgi:translation initiation factor IF-2